VKKFGREEAGKKEKLQQRNKTGDAQQNREGGWSWAYCDGWFGAFVDIGNLGASIHHRHQSAPASLSGTTRIKHCRGSFVFYSRGNCPRVAVAALLTVVSSVYTHG